MLFDTHTHIYLPEFDNDRDDVVHRALENGVTRLMLPNVDLDTLDALQHTLNTYPDMCSAAMGLHPTSVTENYRKDLDRIFEMLDTDSYQAVGEIGIDLYWDKSYQKEQIDASKCKSDMPPDTHYPSSYIVGKHSTPYYRYCTSYRISACEAYSTVSAARRKSFRKSSNRAISTSVSTVSLLSKKARYERRLQQSLSTASCSKPTPLTLHRYLIGEKGTSRLLSDIRQNLSPTNCTWQPSK